MFNFNGLRRRVSFQTSRGIRSVRIERQNTVGLYVWGFCLSTLTFGLMFRVFWKAVQVHADAVLYVIPVFVLVGLCYVIAVAICLWGALGVEEIKVETDELRWTRMLLN